MLTADVPRRSSTPIAAHTWLGGANDPPSDLHGLSSDLILGEFGGIPIILTSPPLQMAVRSSSTLTSFSIQAILNKKEDRGASYPRLGRLMPASNSPTTPACCWRLFGEVEAEGLGAPGGLRAKEQAAWDSDSALSEEGDPGRPVEGSLRMDESGGMNGQRPLEGRAKKEEEEETPGCSDCEMAAGGTGKGAERGCWGHAGTIRIIWGGVGSSDLHDLPSLLYVGTH